jgi:hypothetical protein
VQEAHTGEVDEHTDQGQDDTGDENRADHVAGVTTLRADGDDTADERGAGAQVARHLPVHDEQEDDRRAEHGDDVLRADADGQWPRQALVRGYRLPHGRGLAVPIELPTERHECLLDVHYRLEPVPVDGRRSHRGAPMSHQIRSGGSTSPLNRYAGKRAILHR